jgi:hypothetical protein
VLVETVLVAAEACVIELEEVSSVVIEWDEWDFELMEVEFFE